MWLAGLLFIPDVWKGIEPESGRPIVDPGSQAGYWQAGGVLPIAVGRQGLAVGGLSSENQIGLCAGQSRFLRRASPARRCRNTCQAERYIGRREESC